MTRLSSAISSALASALSSVRSSGPPATLSATLAHVLNDMRIHWRRTPFPAFLAWWKAGLVAWLPSHWRAIWHRTDAENVLLLDMTAPGTDHPINGLNGAFISGLPPSAAPHHTSAGKARGPTVLLLPRRAVLIKSLRLPVAARASLINTLSYDLDRQTPFDADQLAFDARLIEHGIRRAQRSALPGSNAVREAPASPQTVSASSSAGSVGSVGSVTPESDDMLDVELIVIRKDRLLPWVDQVTQAGLQLHGVDVIQTDGRRLGINLLPPALRPAHVVSGRALNGWLLLATGVLSIAALLAWQSGRERTLAQMQAHVDGMQAQALAVMRLRNTVREQMSTASYLTRLKTSEPGFDKVLLQLTEALPNDSWLEHIEIDDNGTVNLAGLSSHATAVIGRLQRADTLQDIMFQGVIEPDAATHQDHFYLSAKLKGNAHAQTSSR